MKEYEYNLDGFVSITEYEKLHRLEARAERMAAKLDKKKYQLEQVLNQIEQLKKE